MELLKNKFLMVFTFVFGITTALTFCICLDNVANVSDGWLQVVFVGFTLFSYMASEYFEEKVKHLKRLNKC